MKAMLKTTALGGLAVLLSVTVSMAGCSDDANDDDAEVAQSSETPPEPDDRPDKAPRPEDQPVETEGSDTADGDDRAADSVGSNETDTDDEETEAGDPGQRPTGKSDDPSNGAEAYPPERLVLLVPEGPLVVDVRVTIDGRPHQEAMAELVEEVLRQADVDGNGNPRWEEAFDAPAIRYGLYGNAEIVPGELNMMLRTYDVDSDGTMDASEVPRFLTENVGSSYSFSLRTSNLHREENRTRSRVRTMLDANEDGSLDAAERASAPLLLRRYDRDADDIVYRSELEGVSGERPVQMMRYGPPAAIRIEEESEWNQIHFAFSELYAYDGDLDAASLEGVPDLFRELDRNSDGKVDRYETAALAESPAHLFLAVDFPAPGTSGSPTLELVELGLDLRDAHGDVHERPGRLTLARNRFDVEVFVNDPVVSEADTRATAIIQALDRDTNQYLDEDEYSAELAGIAIPFELIDQNDDGQIVSDEIHAALSRQQAAQASQVHAHVGHQPDALFAYLDADRDGRLTTRELDGAPDRLAALDRNDNGRISVSEIPGSLAVALARGNPRQPETLFVPSLLSNEGILETLPAWFQGMDTNRDGDLSRLEFLGTDIQFESLDRNGDGLIEGREVEAESGAPDDAEDVEPAEPAAG